eukprot:220503-Heterocapsa_arctica.AAC.1
MARGPFGLAICKVQWPWATKVCVSPRREWPKAHLDSLLAGFNGRGLNKCVFRLGESAPRSTLTNYLRCLGWLGGAIFAQP